MADSLGFDRERLGRLDSVLHRYVDEGRLPCTVVQVARHGEVVHRDLYGWADVGAERAVADDTIFRIYSMTKPIVSVALMILYEEGELLLDNAVSRFVPEFADMHVFVGGDRHDPKTEPARRQMTVHDLLTHQSGITAGFMGGPVSDIYRDNDFGDLIRPPKGTLAEATARLGGMPLVAHPGDRWHYGMSTDVVGRVVEVVSGMELDEFLAMRIFGPLGMVDTGFFVPQAQVDRVAACYARTLTERMRQVYPSGAESRVTKRPEYLSGSGGLASTVADYQRFADMLRLGGTLDGARILGPRTVDFMRTNQLPGGRAMGDDALFIDRAATGIGFGLGFATVIDAPATRNLCANGEYYWGGAASTAFWIDPVNDITAIFMTQLMPSSTYPVRSQLRAGVYQALID